MASAQPTGPNPLRVAWSTLRALRVRRPEPQGSGGVDHAGLAPIVAELDGPNALGAVDTVLLDAYIASLSNTDPDTLSRPGALAFWLNLYNARAIRLAVDAFNRGNSSVLRVPGAFDNRDVFVGGERLSLTDIEHGKIRRFGDPRIHGALVCGSLSCPTLRRTPFTGEHVESELEEQMRYFLASGGAYADREQGTLHLSRVLLWYGADFVRPHRMPTWLPATRRSVARAASRWMAHELAQWVQRSSPKVVFQPYDWGLGCAVA